MRLGAHDFAEIWLVDFEFSAPPGERPRPICVVASEFCSGRTIRMWEDEMRARDEAPYSTAPESLFVAYYASAECGCHLSLNWPLPVNVLDLYAEFRNITNGKETPSGAGLLGALVWYGLDAISAADKDAMRELSLRGGPWTAEEREALLAYCASDVHALRRLLAVMLPSIRFDQALLRGRYMGAAAHIERVGVPIDCNALKTLQDNWAGIQDKVIHKVDRSFQVFEGRTFKQERFKSYLINNNIPWPQLPSGRLALDDDTFRTMTRAYPALDPVRELRDMLSQMRLADLSVGNDGRNRCLLSAFRARTGRNQPSNSRFIFGNASWLRGLIAPPFGYGLAYVDWSQQEFGIAAALSNDQAMIEAYQSGDPYLTFAKQAGTAPQGATKATHGRIREQFKACALAVQYGMGTDALAIKIGQSRSHAAELLRLHRSTYRTFWRWSDGAVDFAMLNGYLYTVFGWTLHVAGQANARSIRNFPMQANGAEMLRLACSRLVEQGIRVCAPVHDAVLIEAPIQDLEACVETTQKIMGAAAESVLGGFRLTSDTKLVRYPDGYDDERGRSMWQTVWAVIGEEALGPCARAPISHVQQCNN